MHGVGCVCQLRYAILVLLQEKSAGRIDFPAFSCAYTAAQKLFYFF